MSVQKCKPSFDEGSVTIKRAPFTQLYNKVLQNCTNLEAIAIWAYLQSQCDNWELNPHQLRKHFKVGKDKIYSILTYMIECNLIIRHVHYGKMHTHIKTTYTVLDGMDFVDAATVIEECVQTSTPVPENPEADYPEPENQDYKKERVLEKKDDQKDKPLIDSAIDIARKRNDDAFDEFWKGYPVKKNKIRTRRIWDKEKFVEIANLICADVLTRIKHEPQWQDKQFIPHPATYLGNKLWTDEVTEASTPKKSSGKSSSFDQYQADLQKQNRGTTYEHGAISQ